MDVAGIHLDRAHAFAGHAPETCWLIFPPLPASLCLMPEDDPLNESAEVAELRAKAEAGDANAQFNLAGGYGVGYGVAQDYAQAAAWYRKAADQGHAGAPFPLGVMYEVGRGVPQDYVEAHKWYDLGASRASTENKMQYAEARDEMATKMSPAQIADAQHRARAWRAAFEQRPEK